MPVPSPRKKILPARGNIADLQAGIGDLLDGEICYAIDQDQYYQKEGAALVSVGATKAQGSLADTAVQPGDNVSELVNDSGYITLAEVPGDLVTSVAGRTGDVVLTKADVGLNNVDNTSDANKPVSTAQQAVFDVKADLVGGFVPTSQIPAIAITEFLGSVGSEAAMLALVGQPGDWCLRTDKAVGYVIIGADPSLTSNWEAFTVPGSAVTSVNSQIGDVVLGFADVGAASAAQGSLADTAVQPGDNVSGLNNDAGYITLAQVPGDAVTSVNTQTGAVVLDADDVGAVPVTGGTFSGNIEIGTGIDLNTSGSARFSSAVNVGAGSAYPGANDGVHLNPTGYMALSRPLGSSSCFLAYVTGSSTPTITFTAGGKGTFAADASINSLTIGLGAGNVATNTAIGRQALLANTTGDYNTAAGYRALFSNTSGIQNTATGYAALYFNDTGIQNTATGYAALNSNDAGNYNTATGHQALRANTTGNSSAATGYGALFSNTTGGFHTASGQQALYSNTIANNNTATGYRTLYFNTEGNNNTATGRQALYNNTTADNNTANGYQALFSNTTGSNNVVSGYAALYSNDAGSNNVASGYAAGYYIEGSNNTILGAYTGTAADSTLSDTVIISAGTTERLRINSTGSLLFGGTLPASPNISLNADGTGVFNGIVRSANPTDSSPGNTLVTKNYLNGTGQSGAGRSFWARDTGAGIAKIRPVNNGDDVVIRDTAGTTETIKLNADGSAGFAGDVGIGTSSPSQRLHVISTSNGTTARFENNAANFLDFYETSGGTRLGYIGSLDNTNWTFHNDKNGYIGFDTNNTERLQIDNLGNMLLGGTLPSAPNITLFATGTGVFGTNPYQGAGTGISINHSGTVRAGAVSGTPIWQGYKNGTTDSTSSITSQGSATFAGQVTSGADAFGTSNIGTGLTPTGSVIARRAGAGNIWLGYQVGTTQQTSQISADGSSTFALDATINSLTIGRGGGNVTNNTATGYQALNSNTTGNYNTATGYQALPFNTTGDFNTATGNGALITNTEGNNNTATGYVALLSNTSGNNNVANGYAALNSNTTGSGNIGIGFINSNGAYAPVFDPTTESSRLILGHTGIINAYVKVAWTVTSDARDKMNFAPVPHGLDFVNQLKPTAYQFKVDRDTETPSGDVRYGFKAQDILALEGDNPVIIDIEDADHLKYKGEHLVPVLVNAVQELTAMVKELQSEIQTLKG